MSLFSERYNYKKASDVIIREQLTPEIQNAICTCYDKLSNVLLREGIHHYPYYTYSDIERYLWTNFLNKREGHYKDFQIVATRFLESDSNEWYNKLDMVEITIKYLYAMDLKYDKERMISFRFFVEQLNFEFKRLNFANIIVDTEIVEITSKEEITAVESAIKDSTEKIKMHLNKALELYSQRPNADYRNSIKESISAVEVFCRDITGENSLGRALNKLNDNGLVIPPILKTAFEKLYAYTNQPETGIRHALMDEDGTYTPASEEALFMLVSCSSFINYLNSKKNKG